MLYFRPHHFLCTLGFQGLGYSPAFVENYKDIVTQLLAPNGDEVIIQVVKHTDSICSPCPHKREQLCKYQAKIDRLDHAHGQALGIRVGDKITWGQAKERIAQHISIKVFHEICSSCSWKSLGVCEQALTNLHNR
ncbi:MAG: hypothetical protein BGO68_03295 [Candidatus Amoebophilus sp. 36-38]|nr:MAG: hypothetical protein BGO68_03295 [Candidatus Amoebophilus sp. 36-38]